MLGFAGRFGRGGLVLGALAGGAMGEQIRWVNPCGGAWGDPKNWDLARVPVADDEVVIDLEASFGVTVDPADPPSWRLLRVDNGVVEIDLGGGVLLSEPTDPDDWNPRRFEVGASATVPTRVRVRNGTLVDMGDFVYKLEPGIRVGAAGGQPAELTVDADAEVGTVMSVRVSGASSMGVDGDLPLASFGFARVDAGSELTVGGDLGGAGDSPKLLNIQVDGRLELGGELSAFDSGVSGTGTVVVRDGGLVGIGAVGVSFVLEGSGAVMGDSYRDCSFDLRATDGSRSVWVDGFGFSSVVGGEGTVILYGQENLAAPPECFIDTAGLVWDVGGRLVFQSEQAPGLGTDQLVGVWDLGGPVDPKVKPVNELVAKVSGPGSAVLRWAVLALDSFELRLLGVPAGWCPADMDFNGQLNYFDLAAFVKEYNAGSAWANTNNDMRLNYFDVSDFIDLYSAGCPQPGP